MANAKYNEGRVEIAKATMDLDTVTLVLLAIDSGYVYDPDHSYSDVSSYVLDTSASLSSNTVDSEGYFYTGAAVFSGLAVGEDPVAFILRESGGSLVAFYDTLADETPVEGTIFGDGTTMTINAPATGWFRN